MKRVLLLGAGAVALLTVVMLIGATLPRTHVASRTLRVRRSPEEIWTLITDVDRFTSWRPDLKRVERLPDRNGHAAWVEHTSSGAIPLETIEAVPPERLVLVIAAPTLPFGGTWTYAVERVADGSALKITEDGYVSNPLFRFVSRVVIGHHRMIDAYLTNVARRFNEEAILR
jgi:uncharacterized protein YndB with AHSA1/START domain